MNDDLVRVSPIVDRALAEGRPVVALETTIVAHGFPADEGLAVGRECERRVRDAGATPATVAVLDGALRVGLDDEQLERVAAAGPDARKVSPRDLAACVVDGAIGATTVGATLAACRLAGIAVMATGGIGGVHRGYAERPDVSADLAEIARARAIVVCSGVKSLLDVRATVEALETLGVPVVGYGTGTLPLFYAAAGGPPVPARADAPGEVVAVARAHWALGREGGVVVARPPEPQVEVSELIEAALREATAQGIEGQAVTPFVLSLLHERSGGKTLEVNRRLAADNAALAAAIAVAYAAGA
ncbi:MAG TPA: pseudouridine-5'-phosphate glycosidase [Gaiellaceae bacterium]|nr:pseudouridine-5'-phosphate glycosidase [Gaiellaceae bacterium]